MLRVFRRHPAIAGVPHPFPGPPGFDNIIDLSAFREQASAPVGPAPPRSIARVVVFRPQVTPEPDNRATMPSIWDRARALIDRLEEDARERKALREERMRRRAVEKHRAKAPPRIADIGPL